jgi:hypothetical protein
MGEEKSKFIYDAKRKRFKHNDGIINKSDMLESFYIYYSWVCEKVDKNEGDYTAWKEMFSFLSLEKYRAYIENEELLQRMLEMGILVYINKAASSKNFKISVLGFRQAIKWGYPSILIHGAERFPSSSRYLKFLYKEAKRYYVEGALKKYSLDAFALMDKFDEFLIGIITLASFRKTELVASAVNTLDASKSFYYKDSEVSWEWLNEELKEEATENDYRKALNLVHLSLNDYLNFELKKSSECTLNYLEKISAKLLSGHSDWEKNIGEEEKIFIAKMKENFKKTFK